MASYRQIPASELEEGRPGTQELFDTLANNPEGIAQRAPTAPVVQVPIYETFSTPGAFSFTVPDGVTRVGYILVGGGEGAGGDGEATTFEGDSADGGASGEDNRHGLRSDNAGPETGLRGGQVVYGSILVSPGDTLSGVVGERGPLLESTGGGEGGDGQAVLFY